LATVFCELLCEDGGGLGMEGARAKVSKNYHYAKWWLESGVGEKGGEGDGREIGKIYVAVFEVGDGR